MDYLAHIGTERFKYCNVFVTFNWWFEQLKRMVKRVSISLDEEQVKLLHSIKGYGTKEAEVVKNILLVFLAEKGYLNKLNKTNSEEKNE